MQKAVMRVMEKHLEKWQSVPEIRNRYDRFVRNLKKIDDHLAVLKTELTPLKKKKTGSRKALVQQLFPITSVLGVYAIDAGDTKLGKLVRMKFSDLEKMKPVVLLKFGNRIHDIAKKLLDAKRTGGKKSPVHMVGDYGLTLNHVEGLREALDHCGADELTHMNARKSKKVSSVKLKNRIKENNSILKKRMDRLMHLFRDQQKAFYDEYKRARIVMKKGGETKSVAKKKTPGKESPPKKSASKTEPVDGATGRSSSKAAGKPAAKPARPTGQSGRKTPSDT